MKPLGKDPDPSTAVGTREHADAITQGRHPGVRDALQWLTYSHLPPELRNYSAPFYLAATAIIRVVNDSPELTTALNKLIEAKDSAVRAGIKTQHGRAGSVPRPQSVVHPPLLTDDGSRPVPGLAGQLALPDED